MRLSSSSPRYRRSPSFLLVAFAVMTIVLLSGFFSLLGRAFWIFLAGTSFWSLIGMLAAHFTRNRSISALLNQNGLSRAIAIKFILSTCLAIDLAFYLSCATIFARMNTSICLLTIIAAFLSRFLRS